MIIESLNPSLADVQDLIAESDAFYEDLYPAESNHLDPLDELSRDHVAFIGCRVEGRLVGCAAIKLMSDDGSYAEVKRLFVKADFRGRGLSRSLMLELEGLAQQWGVPVLRLETGIRQPEALGLYRSMNYRQRGPFGQYQADPLSVFMEKSITPYMA